MEQVFFPPLSRVAICGGTHGNERTGVCMVRQMQKQTIDELGCVSVTAVLANPAAVDAGIRYIDADLNRCFTDALLSAPLTDSSPHELRRAHELNAQLGPKGSTEAVDFICDVHNTTANMGVTLISSNIDWITLHICKYVQSNISSPVRVIVRNIPRFEGPLRVVGKHGLTLEVGPQPHGVVRADNYNMMKKTVDLILEWLQKFNAGSTFEGGEVEVFTWKSRIDYPLDPTTGEMTAAIHPQLQDNDFKLLQPGDPVFMTFSQETVKYEGEALYPFFVNECAYYEDKVAFYMAEKKTLSIPTIRVNKRE